MPGRNEGIIASGGEINVGGSIVVGRGARAHTVVNQPTFAAGDIPDPEVARRVTALEAAIHAHAAQLADKDDAIERLTALVQELHRPQPRGSRVAEILRGLRESAGSVASVITSVASVEHVLALLL